MFPCWNALAKASPFDLGSLCWLCAFRARVSGLLAGGEPGFRGGPCPCCVFGAFL